MVSNQKDADDEIEVCHGDIFEYIVAVISSRGLFHNGLLVQNFMEACASTRKIQLWAGGHENLALNEIVCNTYQVSIVSNI